MNRKVIHIGAALIGIVAMLFILTEIMPLIIKNRWQIVITIITLIVLCTVFIRLPEEYRREFDLGYIFTIITLTILVVPIIMQLIGLKMTICVFVVTWSLAIFIVSSRRFFNRDEQKGGSLFMDIQYIQVLLDKLAADFPADSTITAIRYYITQRLEEMKEEMKNEEVYELMRAIACNDMEKAKSCVEIICNDDKTQSNESFCNEIKAKLKKTMLIWNFVRMKDRSHR